MNETLWVLLYANFLRRESSLPYDFFLVGFVSDFFAGEFLLGLGSSPSAVAVAGGRRTLIGICIVFFARRGICT
jgi:hypothetical protein